MENKNVLDLFKLDGKVALVTGATRHRELETALLRAQLEKSTLSTDLALALAEHGLRDHHLAEVLQSRARADDRPGRPARGGAPGIHAVVGPTGHRPVPGPVGQ